jgi:lysyl-tRNA synthetase, class II
VSAVEERSFVEAARREKRSALEALGVQPFAYRYERSHTAAEAIAAYRDEMGDHGPELAIAGRIESWRPKGKVVFGHIEDPSGRIQVYLRQDDLGEMYELVRLLDLDDHVGVRGRLFRTKAGEITVRASEVSLLAKSLRPLPRGKTQTGPEGTVTFGGLADPELRYRQRYADLAVHPDVRHTFVLRAQALRSSGGFSTSGAFWRSRPQCCSHCMGVLRLSRSSPITMRSTCRCICVSPTSCT